jgi:hypothetical protein
MNTRRLAAVLIAGAALVAGAARVEAQPAALSERGYEQIRSMADDLDHSAQHAADSAQHSRSWFYSHDREFQRSVVNFARRARSFNQRMANYRTHPWNVDDELRGLLADARSVEARLQQARERDPHVLDDWNHAVAILNDMTDLYGNDLARRPYGDRRDRWHDDRNSRPSGDVGTYREGPAYRDDRGNAGGRSSTASLVSDVSERANRLSERARQLAGPIPADERQRMAWTAIQKLAQDASALGARIDRGGEPRDLRSAVAQLNADATEADRQIRAGNVFPEIKAQWADLMQSINRLRQSVGS